MILGFVLSFALFVHKLLLNPQHATINFICELTKLWKSTRHAPVNMTTIIANNIGCSALQY
jgi:hypothetical protein